MKQQLFTRLALAVPALALVASAAALNLWAVTHPKRVDLTSGGVYSIGPQTREVLARLREPVTVTFFHDLRSKDMADALALLRQYAAASPLLTVQAFDPAIAPAEARRQQVQFAGTAVFESAGRRVVVNGGSEADFTNGLIRVTAQGGQTLCFTEGHAEADPNSLSTHDHFEGDMGSGHSHSSGGRTLVVHERHGMGMARNALQTLGYTVRALALTRGPDELKGCSVVVIAGPQQGFEAGEVEQLRRWALAGGRLLALVDPFVATGLGPLFAEFRMQVEPKRVLDPKSHYWTDDATPAVSSYPRHKITRKLPLTFYPGAASLAPLAVRGAAGSGVEVKLTPLVQSSEAASAVALDGSAAPGDEGAQTLAALGTRQLPGGGRAELILFGDGDFATNSFFHVLGNGALFLNAVSHLAEQDRLLDITPRNYEVPRVQMTNTQMRATFVLSTVVMPALALALSLVAWWRRRRG